MSNIKEYWGFVVCSALVKTKDFFGWNQRTAIAAIITYGIGSVIYLYVRGSQAVVDQWIVTIAFLVVPFGVIAIMVFLWKLITVPAITDRELRDKSKKKTEALETQLEDLKKQLETKKASQQIIYNLRILYRNGEDLLKSDRKPNPHEWRQKIIKWCHEVEGYMQGNVPDDELWIFHTYVTIPDSNTKFDDCSIFLEERLKKLRLIIGRLTANNKLQQDDNS